MKIRGAYAPFFETAFILACTNLYSWAFFIAMDIFIGYNLCKSYYFKLILHAVTVVLMRKREDDIMSKKSKSVLIVVVVVVIAIVLVMSLGGKKQASNFTKQDKSWQNDFVVTLDEEGYLGSDIVADLKGEDVKKSEEDGSDVFVVSKLDSKGADIHNIQYAVKDDVLNFYHYKNYSFKTKDGKKIEKSEAEKIVKNFAKEFISNGEELKFENTEEQQVQSLYDKGKVETWYGKDKNGEYSIVVDLEKGYVVYYSMS